MRQEEIFKLIIDKRRESGESREHFEKRAGTVLGGMHDTLNGKNYTVGMLYIIKMLDALNLQLVVEDKDTNWGPDMGRLRMMPKKLFTGQRIEARDMIKKEGLYSRVDLFETPEEVLKFVPTPCDIYEINPSKLYRKKFDVVEHPFGMMYSYNEHIMPDFIKNMVTHR